MILLMIRQLERKKDFQPFQMFTNCKQLDQAGAMQQAKIFEFVSFIYYFNQNYIFLFFKIIFY